MLTQCTSCKQQLSVLDDMLDQQHTCPFCQHVFPVASLETAREQPTQELRVAEPVEAAEPDLVKCPFCAKRIPGVASYCPYCGENLEEGEADDQPQDYSNYGPRRDAEPHRAGLILIMAIASTVLAPMAICCSFLGAILTIPGLVMGIAAWRMAHVDLQKMQAGVMDRRGRPTVQAARVCAIIGTVLCSLATLVVLALVTALTYSTMSQPTIVPAPPPSSPPGLPQRPFPAPQPPVDQKKPAAAQALPCPYQLASLPFRIHCLARVPCQA